MGWVTIAAGCARERETTCQIDVGDYIGPLTGYLYDTRYYCVRSQAECDDTCAELAGRPDIGACGWMDSEYCWDGNLPPSLVEAEVCAIEVTISCGGSPSTSVQCGNCGVLDPGSSDYDPSTDCLTQHGSTIGHGTSCDEATGDLEGGASCPYTNDGECDEPEGTNLCEEGTDYPDCP